MLKLSKTAPWNPSLGNPYRTRWTELDGRKFQVRADRLDGVWFISEVDQDGRWNPGSFSDLAMTLAEARRIIESEVSGVPWADPRRDHYEPRDGVNATVDYIARRARVNPSWLESLMSGDSVRDAAAEQPTADLDQDPANIYANVRAVVLEYHRNANADDDWGQLFADRLWVSLIAHPVLDPADAAALADPEHSAYDERG